MLLLGIVWFGRAFNIYSTITQAAQQGAITAARSTCATCGNAFPPLRTVDNAVYAVMQASSLDVTQINCRHAFPPVVAGPLRKLAARARTHLSRLHPRQLPARVPRTATSTSARMCSSMPPALPPNAARW